jgi:hypothetical protein
MIFMVKLYLLLFQILFLLGNERIAKGITLAESPRNLDTLIEYQFVTLLFVIRRPSIKMGVRYKDYS